MTQKIVINLILISFLISTISYFETVDHCGAADSVLPKFYVDLTYDNSTPGWDVDHFNSIQAAIGEAVDGDRIIVYNGEYHERIVINESIDLFGEDAEETIISGGNSGSVITVNATNVDLSTFTIKNSGSGETDAGVKVNANNCKIIDNIISDCNNGIFIRNYNETTIAYNSITDNTYGIFLSLSSSDNAISYNNIYSNSYDGVFLNKTCNDNSITSNEIYSNTGGNGIYLHDHCNNNYISDNIIYSNGVIGIRIENSSNNQIVNGNTIRLHSSYYGIMIVGNDNSVEESTIQNNKHGIFLLADNDTVIYNNTITANTLDGIRLQNSTSNEIYTNTITDNSRYGIYINYFSVSNVAYDNYFEDNEYNAWDISNYANSWNISCTGTNIIGGSKIGGNFWDDYDGADSDQDGIGETDYDVPPGNKIDYLPLVSRIPTADAGGPYSIYLGETITFDGSKSICPDGSITSYSWDFGDGTTGSGQKPSHEYTSAGEYEVLLTVTNSYSKTDTANATAIIMEDTELPSIVINEHGRSSSSSNIYTYSAYVTDNVGVESVTIEYWYNETEKMTANLEKISGDLYKKTIVLKYSPEKVYCVIYANDSSGNIADTKNPYADIGGPYTDYQVLQEISFDGSESYDLDGSIAGYSWDFGDGATGEGKIVSYTYLTNEEYTVTLTVTDNDGNTCNENIVVSIEPWSSIYASNAVLSSIENKYNITLTEQFIAYDTDGDGKHETFDDPNNILKIVNDGLINISGEYVFLISTGDDDIPEFMWYYDTNEIVEITNVAKNNIDPEEDGDTAIAVVTNEKTGWICLNINDEYQYAGLTVKVNGTIISEDRIWRKGGRIYVLDDPEIEYQFIYENIILPKIIEWIIFTPKDGSTIDQNNPTITIEYNVPVTVEYADFYNWNTTETIEILNGLETTDYKKYTYTPPNDLPSNSYNLKIEARDETGTLWINASDYNFVSYEEQGFDFFSIIPYIGIIAGICVAAFFLSKKFNISLESFVYIKNRKIIPFFKPIVFGPLSLDVNDRKISKAEFYVNGELKDTLTQEPYVWKWDEHSFMKQKIETKVFDQQGNSSSSGEMTFYVFNPKLFK